MNGIQPGNVTIDDPLIRTPTTFRDILKPASIVTRSEEHTSELQSRSDLVCRLLLEKKKTSVRNLDCLAGTGNWSGSGLYDCGGMPPGVRTRGPWGQWRVGVVRQPPSRRLSCTAWW